MNEKEYTVTVEALRDLDELYEDADKAGPGPQKHRFWEILVDELRKIRRLVEAGVTVKIEGTETVLTTWQGFYEWAHGRYHLLEDGCDRWIGDDN